MKRRLFFLILFFIGFVGAYLFLSFCISAFRIKLEAPPLEYFFASLKHMVLFKSLISFVIGIILGLMERFFWKNYK